MVQPPHAAQKLRIWFGLKEDFVPGSSTDAVVKVRLFRAADRHYILAVLALSRTVWHAHRGSQEGNFELRGKGADRCLLNGQSS
jgi:hypothetical protein